MISNEQGPNDGIPEKLNALRGFLEPVDPSELQTEDVPTVEVAVLDKPRTGFWTAVFWFVLFSTLFLGFFITAVAIVKGNYSQNQKILKCVYLALGVGGIGLAFVIYSAIQKGFTFGKAVLWCALFVVVTQFFPLVPLTICAIIALRFHPEIKVDDPAALMSSPGAQIFLQGAILFCQAVTIVFSLTILRWAVGREWNRKIALRLPNLEHVILVAIAMPALLIVSIALEQVLSHYLPSIKQFGIPNVNDFVQSTATWPWGIAVLAIGIGPAIGEELWCRGFLGQGLASRYGNWGCVLLASFLFGLIHIEPPQAVGAFLMGIVLYLCYLASRSILIPMLMHFINNTLGVLDESKTGPLPIANTLETAYQSRPLLALSASLFVLITVGFIMYSSRVRIWAPEGAALPSASYPNVEYPLKTNANKAEPGSTPVAAVVALVVAACHFGAVWFGLYDRTF